MLPEQIIEPGTLVRRGERVAVGVRMPWYRALPLSSLAAVHLSVDGVEVPAGSMTWTLDGATYRLADLPARHDTWWYVLDTAVVEGDLPRPAGGEPGDRRVAVTLELYIPYITTDLGVLRIEEKDAKRLPMEVVA